MRLGSLVAALLIAAAPAQAQEQSQGAPARDTAAHGAAVQGTGIDSATTASEVVDAEVRQSLTGEPSQAGEQAAGHGAGDAEANPDIIMPHITDSRHMEVPCFNAHFACAISTWPESWGPLKIGGLDITPTKHTWMLLLAAFLCGATLITAATAHQRHHHEVGRPRGFASGIEAMVLFIRDEVILKNVGHHGQGFVPFLMTMFWFILFANVLGLIPYGATATGNISVTATLALIAFITIEIAGMRAQGMGYLNTIFYWPHDMKFGFMKVVLFLILTPVELLGKFTKPFALAIRLFANMTAGHVIVLAFIGIIFTFGSWAVAPAPFAMALAIMVLEVLVAFLQAYIFTLLVSVFIGQIREAHH